MIYERIPMSETDKNVFLEAYIANSILGKKRKAILVFPGGSYAEICSDREGEPIALAFMPYGFNAFVLHYSIGGEDRVYPLQLREVALAMKHIKDHADEYGIDPNELFIVGFSAGGHLAASSGVFWKRPEVTKGLDIPYGYNKPKGVMPIYPVINPEGHRFSFSMLLGTPDSTKEELDYVSVDQHVDRDSSPAFIMHTFADRDVDVRNTLSLAKGYADAGVPFEMHIYPNGYHGVALANKITDMGNPAYDDPIIAEWVRLAAAWTDKVDSLEYLDRN